MLVLPFTIHTVPLCRTLLRIICKVKENFIFLILFDYIYLLNFSLWNKPYEHLQNACFIFFLKLFLVELILYQLFLNSGNINIFLSKGKISECIWIAYEKVAQKFNYVISSNKKVVGTVLTLSTSHISGKGYLS